MDKVKQSQHDHANYTDKCHYSSQKLVVRFLPFQYRFYAVTMYRVLWQIRTTVWERYPEIKYEHIRLPSSVHIA